MCSTIWGSVTTASYSFAYCSRPFGVNVSLYVMSRHIYVAFPHWHSKAPGSLSLPPHPVSSLPRSPRPQSFSISSPLPWLLFGFYILIDTSERQWDRNITVLTWWSLLSALNLRRSLLSSARSISFYYFRRAMHYQYPLFQCNHWFMYM